MTTSKKIISSEFNPSITFPAYLVRKRLLDGISREAINFRGIMLDFGCGSKPYKPLFEKVDKYIGVDFENPGHSHEQEQIDVVYNGHHIPFEDGHFDCAFSSEVFEHVFNIDEILPEIHRVLKPGGLILVTCPFAICEHEQPTDYARYSSFALKYLFVQHGFEIVVFEKLGNSIEVITQLLIMYIHMHISPVFRKIPVVRSLFRLITYSFLNISALAFGKILPQGKELYLNNLIVCRRK